MSTSIFDLFRVGIGPSSSHTVGPMRAARRFVHQLGEDGLLGAISEIKAELLGRGRTQTRLIYADLISAYSGIRPNPRPIPENLVALAASAVSCDLAIVELRKPQP